MPVDNEFGHGRQAILRAAGRQNGEGIDCGANMVTGPFVGVADAVAVADHRRDALAAILVTVVENRQSLGPLCPVFAPNFDDSIERGGLLPVRQRLVDVGQVSGAQRVTVGFSKRYDVIGRCGMSGALAFGRGDAIRFSFGGP